MKRSSGAASINGIKAGGARLQSRVFAAPEEDRATGVARPQRGPRSSTTDSTASDKNRIRDRPGDLRLFADRAPPDRGTRRLLQHHGSPVVGLEHVAAPFAG